MTRLESFVNSNYKTQSIFNKLQINPQNPLKQLSVLDLSLLV